MITIQKLIDNIGYELGFVNSDGNGYSVKIYNEDNYKILEAFINLYNKQHETIPISSYNIRHKHN